MSDNKVLPTTIIDLKVFDTLIKEFNEQFAKTQAIKDSGNANTPEYVAEAAKCMGLISGVAIEASALSQDFMKDIRINSAPSVSDASALYDPASTLESLFKPYSDKKKN